MGYKDPLRSAILIWIFLLISLTPGAWAQEKGWEAHWSKMIAGARREGRLVLAGPPESSIRQALTSKFAARFGIPVEYIGGRGGEMRERIIMEHQAGVFTIDVYLGGDPNLYQAKVLDPVKPALILPEVVSPSNWENGRLWFMDPEDKYVLRLFNNVVAVFDINTRYVRPEEVTSVRYFLDPKWRGKISAYDPRVTGTGNARATYFYLLFGEEFIKQLYIDQKPVITRDRRQMGDWLARGTYPIALGAQSEEVERLREEGFPVMQLNHIPDAPGYLSAGSGLISAISRAPHPNAAKVFINWLASKEGLEAYARAQLDNPLRTDIDKSFLDPGTIPRPGVKYRFDSADWKFQIQVREKVRLRFKELLK